MLKDYRLVLVHVLTRSDLCNLKSFNFPAFSGFSLVYNSVPFITLCQNLTFYYISLDKVTCVAE